MKHEIGGYIELDESSLASVHQGCLELDSGRAGLEYLILARNIKTIWLPDYLCDSVRNHCKLLGVKVLSYRVDRNFQPVLDFDIAEDEFLYLVDYFGQLTESSVSLSLSRSNGRLIIDKTQNLFSPPTNGVDTLYSVRKYLGVPDGGYLCTEARLSKNLPPSTSRSWMDHILGRFEDKASNHYPSSKSNNERFDNQRARLMSKLTQSLIGSLNLNQIRDKRKRNYEYLQKHLDGFNKLQLTQVPEGPFAYPLYVVNGPEVRSRLAERKIYIPCLWPNLLNDLSVGELARDYAENILPLPVDQRYNLGDMEDLVVALREAGAIPGEHAGKKLAILGGTLISCEIVEAARRMGVHTTVIDYNQPADSPAKLIADEHAEISVADTHDVADYIREHDIDGVLTGYSDSILGFYADICEYAGLPCYGTKKQFQVFSDKKLWKELCRQYGVPTAREYDMEILDRAEDAIPFPLFVKPSDGSGARGTAVARTKNELLGSVENARTQSKNGSVVIEDYLDGPELTVFWLFVDGDYYVTLLGDRLVKHNQPGYIPLPAGYIFPSSALPAYLRDIAPAMESMLKSQGIKNGMMFLQCSFVDGVPYVYDIGYRLTGSLEHRLLRAAAGYDPMQMMIRYAISGCMTSQDKSEIRSLVEIGRNAPGFNVSILMDTGVIDHFEGLDIVESRSSVVGVVKAHLEGEALPDEAKGELRQISVRILGIVDSVDQLCSEALRVQELVHVVDPEGNDLKLDGLEIGDFARVVD